MQLRSLKIFVVNSKPCAIIAGEPPKACCAVRCRKSALKAFTLNLLGALLCLASAQLAAGKPKPGDVPPDELGRTFAGEQIKVSDQPGSVRVVTFWATWCAPCRTEMSVLNQVQRQVSEKHTQVIGVNIEDRRTFKRVIAKLGRELNIKLTHDASGAVARKYRVGPIPHTVLIGREGRIASIRLGFSKEHVDDLIAALNALLAVETP